jgi:predicted enzyme related to lactoylglutathione lyase
MYSPNSLGADELAGRQRVREAQTMMPFVGWFEITGKDGPALQRLYSKLFGWSINDAGDHSGYGLVEAGEKGIAGGIGASQDGEQGGVTFYVEVDDPAAFLERAEKPGGKTVVPPTKIPDFGLTFAFFADPNGHVVGLSGGAVQ